MHHRSLFLLLASSTLGTTGYLHAQDDLLAYEGFEYTSATTTPPNLILDQLNGGIGWNGPWQDSTSQSNSTKATVESESLSYTDEANYQLLTTGGHAWVEAVPASEAGGSVGYDTKIRRTLANPPVPTPNETLYFSFIGQRRGEAVNLEDDIWHDTSIYPDGYRWGDNLYPRGASVSLLDSDSGTSATGLLGSLSEVNVNQWSLVSESTHIDTGVPFTDLALVVVRLDYTAHRNPNLRGELVDEIGTIATVWINPASLLTEDSSDAMRSVVYRDLVDPYEMLIHGIGIETGTDTYNRPHSAIAVDEIRLGRTWDSVTPVVGGKPPVETPDPIVWNEQEATANGYIYAGTRLGWLWIVHAPWVYSANLDTWIYLTEEQMASGQIWAYVLNMNE